MDSISPIAWGIASVGAIATMFFVWFINVYGKRAQALAWFPASIAILTLIWNQEEPTHIDSLLEAAFSSQIILLAFVWSYSFMLGAFKNKTWNFAIKSILLWLFVIFCLAVTIIWVWYINEKHLGEIAFITGLLGILGMIPMSCGKDNNFENFKEQKHWKTCCSTKKEKGDNGCTGEHTMIIIVSGVGTFGFILFPYILSNNGYQSLAGIVSNSPKIIIVIMGVLWFAKGCSCCKNNETNEAPNDYTNLREHLIMFAYSTFISASFIIILWMNTVLPQGEKISFGTAWGISTATSFVLSLIIFSKLFPTKTNTHALNHVKMSTEMSAGKDEEVQPLTTGRTSAANVSSTNRYKPANRFRF